MAFGVDFAGLATAMEAQLGQLSHCLVRNPFCNPSGVALGRHHHVAHTPKDLQVKGVILALSPG